MSCLRRSDGSGRISPLLSFGKTHPDTDSGLLVTVDRCTVVSLRTPVPLVLLLSHIRLRPPPLWGHDPRTCRCRTSTSRLPTPTQRNRTTTRPSKTPRPSFQNLLNVSRFTHRPKKRFRSFLLSLPFSPFLYPFLL